MQGHVQAKLLLDDCYQDIDADGDPDLRPHSVLGSAVEAFDAQVLLDPLEKQFHLPSAPVQGANGQRRQLKLVGQEHQVLAGLGIAIADAAQVAGVVLGGIEAVKGDGLVADEPRVAIHRRRVHAPCLTSCILPSEMWMKVGIDPRRSSNVCSFTAALVERNGAHGNIDRHRSMVVASRAYTVLASSTPKASST